LHAFLNAAYAVTQILPKEAKPTRRKRYEKWEREWDTANPEAVRLLMELEWEVRGHAIHRGDLELTHKSEKVPVSMERHPYQPHQHNLRLFMSQLRQEGAWTYSDSHFITFDDNEQDVIKVCEQYTQLITKKVHDCEINLKSAQIFLEATK
jgi:hypothetical protein